VRIEVKDGADKCVTLGNILSFVFVEDVECDIPKFGRTKMASLSSIPP
jgi:proline racemase